MITAVVAFVLTLAAMPFAEVNQSRPSLPPLAYSVELSQVAESRAQDLARAGKIDYSGSVLAFQGLMDCGWQLVAENLWRGNVEPSKPGVVKAWRESPPHYAAMLRPDIRWAGWGQAQDGQGFWYVVLLMGTR